MAHNDRARFLLETQFVNGDALHICRKISNETLSTIVWEYFSIVQLFFSRLH